MLREYFAKGNWRTMMPGIDVCHIEENNICKVPEQRKNRSEIFFCFSGFMTLHLKEGIERKVKSEDILFLSNSIHLDSVKFQEPTNGILFSTEPGYAFQYFEELCEVYGGLPAVRSWFHKRMQKNQGCYIEHVIPWNHAFYYTLGNLEEKDQAQYCIMKSFELVYLLFAKSRKSEISLTDNYMAGMAEEIKNYIENHIDEKLTIVDLSRKFRISQTLCKSCFSERFGVPIHQWILTQRMEKAGELLRNTRMTVLEIAQEVGYEGVSQFNVIFKRYYGKTPREFRKMSFSSCF